jgi:hypothetical protein
MSNCNVRKIPAVSTNHYVGANNQAMVNERRRPGN